MKTYHGIVLDMFSVPVLREPVFDEGTTKRIFILLTHFHMDIMNLFTEKRVRE